MNLIFLTQPDIGNINERGIYHDLLRKFRDEGHNVTVVYSSERKRKIPSTLRFEAGITLLNVTTLNIQKTSVAEKGVGILLLEYQYLKAIKKHFSEIKFDLVLYSTPPITLTKVVQYLKARDGAVTYLLLKDIFPQNAVDLGMLRKGGVLHHFFSKKEKQLYKVSDFIGCMSPANVEFVLKNNPELISEKVEVNPNSISPVSIHFSEIERRMTRQKYGIPEQSIVFIYGGNLGKPQGIDFLIEVLNSNVDREGAFFIIVGSGTEYNKIFNWHTEKNPGNVVLKNFIPKAEYDELLKACDVGFIFLDKRFTIPNFPSRLLSYLEHKMPVIAATDINTDLGEILQEAKCGYWCESGDLVKFNSHLTQIMQNAEILREMRENAYRLLISAYQIERTYQLIVAKYEAKHVLENIE